MITKIGYQVYAKTYEDLPEIIRRYAGYDPGSIRGNSPYYFDDRDELEKMYLTEDYNFVKNREAFLNAYPYIRDNELIINDRYPDLIDSAAMDGNLSTWTESKPAISFATATGGALAGGLLGMPIGKMLGHTGAGMGIGAALGGLGGGYLTYKHKTSEDVQREDALADELVARLKAEYNKKAW